MKLNDAHRMQLTEAKFVTSGIPILEDGEGPTWNMDYSNWKNDPHPRILLLGSYRHPNTGNNLVGGVNLNYLTPQQVNNLSKVLPKIMGGNNLYQRYHRGKDVLPDVFDNFYRTYDPRYISGVKQGVIYPKKGFLKTAQDFLKKTAGLLYKSKEQRAKDALPKFGSDLTSMQDTLDQAEVPNLPGEEPDTPQVQAARDAFLRYQREKQLAQQQNVERQEDEPFIDAARDYENQQLGVTPEPTSPSSPSPMQRPANQPPAQAQQRPEARPKDPLEITPNDPPEEQPQPPQELEETVRYYSPIHKRYIVESIIGDT